MKTWHELLEECLWEANECISAGKNSLPGSSLAYRWERHMFRDLHIFHRNIQPRRSLLRWFDFENKELVPLTPYGAVVDLVAEGPLRVELLSYFSGLNEIPDSFIFAGGMKDPYGVYVEVERVSEIGFKARHVERKSS